MFKEIDRYVLLHTERFAHFMQKNFGIKPIRIALIGDVLFACSLISRWFIPEVSITVFVKTIDLFVVAFVFYYTLRVYPEHEKDLDREVMSGLSNKEKISSVGLFFRLLSLSLFLLSILKLGNELTPDHLNGVLMMFGVVVALYFSACDPLPPGPSRLRLFFQSILRRKLAPNL